jgi:hypothetical protein
LRLHLRRPAAGCLPGLRRIGQGLFQERVTPEVGRWWPFKQLQSTVSSRPPPSLNHAGGGSFFTFLVRRSAPETPPYHRFSPDHFDRAAANVVSFLKCLDCLERHN